MSSIRDLEGKKENILTIRDLSTYFYTYEGVVKALDGVNLSLNMGDALGLVGETGCGKSVTALSILRLVPYPGKIVKGEILFKGEDLLKKTGKEMMKIRGKQIAMIFQEPTSSLDPIYKTGDQIIDVIKLHQKVNKDEARRRAIEMLNHVSMPNPEKVLDKYPYELSGGMNQRAMVATALACKPDLLIADEPTTALDTMTQAQILLLMKNLLEKFGLTLLMITHNLAIVARVCDKMAVMYAGVIVESGDVKTIFKNPLHPYTRGLLGAITSHLSKKERLNVIKGTLPNLIYPPSGCRFHPRCKLATKVCGKEKPKSLNVGDDHFVACHQYSKI